MEHQPVRKSPVPIFPGPRPVRSAGNRVFVNCIARTDREKMALSGTFKKLAELKVMRLALKFNVRGAATLQRACAARPREDRDVHDCDMR